MTKDRVDDLVAECGVVEGMGKWLNSTLTLGDKEVRHNTHRRRFLIPKSNIGQRKSSCEK